jgi:hypothetical protein
MIGSRFNLTILHITLSPDKRSLQPSNGINPNSSST